MKSPITKEEASDLVRLELEVESGRKSWIAAGRALIEIRDRELYRSEHDDFWSYCETRWGWKRRNALYVIESYEVYSKLPDGVQNFAQSASQARALAKVPEEKRAEVLEKAAQTGKVTAKTIEEAAADKPELPPPPPPRPVDDEWKAALGVPTAEPPVTEYYTRLERLVDDALENATDKQLVSMSVFASKVCHIIKTELREREQRRKKEKAA